MKITDRYANYDKRVIDYMTNVVNCLQEDYGVVNKSWLVSLDLIANQLVVYFNAMDDIEKNGMYHNDERGRTARNPMFLVMTQANDRIVKLLQNFGLTPMSKSKMKSIDSNSSQIDLYEQIIG